MRAICVDDEPLAVEYTLGQCARLPEIGEAKGFTDARAALDWLRSNPADIAILDINMPEIDGITLAAQIKQLCPQTAILFLTAYKEYAFDAYSVHPAGYLLKPVSLEKLAAEVRHACGKTAVAVPPRVQIRTFGQFDVFVEGRPISFKLAKAKEILAYLVDRQGAGVTRAELFAAIWEDRPYDRGMQKQLDVYIRSLRDTLKAHGIGDIFELKRGAMRVFPERFECDMYRLLKGDAQAVNDYHGEYMRAYGWASVTEALLSEKHRRV